MWCPLLRQKEGNEGKKEGGKDRGERRCSNHLRTTFLWVVWWINNFQIPFMKQLINFSVMITIQFIIPNNVKRECNGQHEGKYNLSFWLDLYFYLISDKHQMGENEI